MEVSAELSDYTPEDLERFVSLLRRDNKTGCLLWTGSVDNNGYGRFRVQRKRISARISAHRLAWLLAGNKITKKKPHILHGCPQGPNPLCCEVSHLRAGTQKENNLDTARIGNAGRKRIAANSLLPTGVKIKASGRYQARLTIDGRHRSFGCFDTVKEAYVVAETIRRKRLGLPPISEARLARMFRHDGRVA